MAVVDQVPRKTRYRSSGQSLCRTSLFDDAQRIAENISIAVPTVIAKEFAQQFAPVRNCLPFVNWKGLWAKAQNVILPVVERFDQLYQPGQ